MNQFPGIPGRMNVPPTKEASRVLRTANGGIWLPIWEGDLNAAVPPLHVKVVGLGNKILLDDTDERFIFTIPEADRKRAYFYIDNASFRLPPEVVTVHVLTDRRKVTTFVVDLDTSPFSPSFELVNKPNS